ncbi:ATP cone domain-containing protein [Lutibacter sp.]|uniref:ATP cone domain-containing protein n=1 Tax=Lutibacter sp. TaxID=1925666 RepID=UPI0025BC75E4|nr:ATP cone domain-containing protein [Lutibacter sp.]MCF6181714.1 restriction endonuclease [Lutibacter sp.]
MNKKVITVKKNSGELEPFSFQKLQNSLQRSGASTEVTHEIIECIKPKLYNGISTKEIYSNAFSLLKKHNRLHASKFSLKKAIFDLGPTGYPFERLVGALLKQKGFKTKVGIILPGKCVTHEIDVLAEKDSYTYAIECKFHLKPNYANNVKIPLYINSRFLDIKEQWNKNSQKKSFLKQGWIVTNTKFTEDAINYAKCSGLLLLSWDYPKNNGIKNNIDKFGLYPITVLTSLSKREKKLLIEYDVILTKELLEASLILKKLEFSDVKVRKVLSEAQNLCDLN